MRAERQIQHDAAMRLRQKRHHLAPEIGVGEPAMREHDHRAVAARDLFAKKGFADTATEDILGAAGVTRGALYHHFDNKAALFRAVFDYAEAALTARLMKVAQAQPDALSGLHAGCRAFLEACLDPVVQRIVLRDARAVLSLDELREVESRYTLAALRNGLANAIASGAMVERPVDLLQ